MRLYKCQWPDGDVTVVLARSVEEALDELEEVGTATADMISLMKEFMVTFTPTEIEDPAVEETDFKWGVLEMGECMERVFPDVLEAERMAQEYPPISFEEGLEDATCSGDCEHCDRHVPPNAPPPVPVDEAIANAMEVTEQIKKRIKVCVEYLCNQIPGIPNVPPPSKLVAVIKLGKDGNDHGAIIDRQDIGRALPVFKDVIQKALELPLTYIDDMLVLTQTLDGKGAFVVNYTQVMGEIAARLQAMGPVTAKGSTASN